MTEQCNRCRFWLEDMSGHDPNDPDFGFGRCRLRPPTVSETYVAALMPKLAYGQQEDPEIDTVSLATATLFPATNSIDWCGSFQPLAQGPTVIQQAFAELCAAHGGLAALQEPTTDADTDPFYARFDRAHEIIMATPSTCDADTACKLRVGLAGSHGGAEATLLLYRLAADDGTGIGTGFLEELIYSLILELEGGK